MQGMVIHKQIDGRIAMANKLVDGWLETVNELVDGWIAMIKKLVEVPVRSQAHSWFLFVVCHPNMPIIPKMGLQGINLTSLAQPVG